MGERLRRDTTLQAEIHSVREGISNRRIRELEDSARLLADALEEIATFKVESPPHPPMTPLEKARRIARSALETYRRAVPGEENG